MQDMVRAELARMFMPLIQGQKDIVPAGPYNTGPGGIFNIPSLNRQFISLIVQPQGLAAELANYPSMFAQPEFGYITGFGDVTGSRAVGVCDDARIPGSVLTCIQTAHYGRYRFDTKPLEVNRVGLLQNAADPLDFTLMNGPLMNVVRNIMPQNVSGNYAANMFNPRMEMASRMSDVARAFGDHLAHQLWEGDPSDMDGNTADGGESEYPGLNILVGTNKLDARTGTPCPALRSDIKDFQHANVTSNAGHDLFNALYYMVQTRKYIAKRTGMGQVVWNLAMREAMWDEIAKMWPCVAATYGCIPDSSGNTVTPVINLDAQARMRQDMLDNPQITIAGTTLTVVIDDALPEESIGGGTFEGDIWLLPRSVRNGFDVLFFQHVDYNQGALPAADQAGMGAIFRTDNGTFLWWSKPNNNVCIQLGVKTEQRVVLLTPHLAGRLENVRYTALQHGPDPYRGQDYFDASGEGPRSDTQFDPYSDWNLSGPGTN